MTAKSLTGVSCRTGPLLDFPSDARNAAVMLGGVPSNTVAFTPLRLREAPAGMADTRTTM